MISYFQIQRLASQKEVSEDIIEKDYFMELILYYLSDDNFFNERVIFRGGTALKKIYFSDYRYSEDLDFLIEDKEKLSDYSQRFDRILIKISSDFPFKPTKTSRLNNDRLQIFISYDVVSDIRVIKELKLDILKDVFIPSFRKKKIIFTYQDFKEKDCKLNTYILESVAADKISRILDVDKEARDIYDLWYLLNLDLDISKIKGALRKRFGYELYSPNLLKEINSEAYKQSWKIRLNRQVKGLPPYELVIDQLEKLIKNKLFLHQSI